MEDTETNPPKVSPSTLKPSTNSKDIVGAVFMIFLGTMLLLNTTGVVSWSIWWQLWRFWPVFLILVGVQIIVGKSLLSNILVTILAILSFGLIGLTVLSLSGINVGSQFNLQLPKWWLDVNQNLGSVISDTVSIPLTDYDNIHTRNLSLDIDAGEFTISDSDSTVFFELKSRFSKNYGQPKVTESQDHEELSIMFQQENTGLNSFNSSIPEYDFMVGQPDLKTNMELTLGTGSGVLNMNTVVLNDLLVDIGTGSLELTLGKKSLPTGVTTLDIGTGELILRIPKEVGYKVKYDLGVGSVKFGDTSVSGLGSKEDSFQSENYEESESKLELELNVGVGSFELLTE